MEDYYAERLAAEKLRRCYEIAPPRIRQYLRAELDFALEFIHAGDAVLDLGCGYGRTLPELAARAGSLTAVDNAPASIALAEKIVAGLANVDGPGDGRRRAAVRRQPLLRGPLPAERHIGVPSRPGNAPA